MEASSGTTVDVNGEGILPDLWLSVNAKSSKEEIKEFQIWYNQRLRKMSKPNIKIGGFLVEDGVWGKNTSSAWEKTKNEYPSKAQQTIIEGKPISPTRIEGKPISPASTPTPETEIKSETKGGILDKFKALSTPVKVAIVAIPVLVIGFMLYRKK